MHQTQDSPALGLNRRLFMPMCTGPSHDDETATDHISCETQVIGLIYKVTKFGLITLCFSLRFFSFGLGFSEPS